DRIGIARELFDRDGLVQWGQARGRHGGILLAVGLYVPRRSILAGEKQRNPVSAAPAGAKPARSSTAPEPNKKTKPDYTGRKTGIDSDNRAVEGNACERRQACSLMDIGLHSPSPDLTFFCRRY